jgi:hypothetical protein
MVDHTLCKSLFDAFKKYANIGKKLWEDEKKVSE